MYDFFLRGVAEPSPARFGPALAGQVGPVAGCRCPAPAGAGQLPRPFFSTEAERESRWSRRAGSDHLVTKAVYQARRVEVQRQTDRDAAYAKTGAELRSWIGRMAATALIPRMSSRAATISALKPSPIGTATCRQSAPAPARGTDTAGTPFPTTRDCSGAPRSSIQSHVLSMALLKV